MWDLKIDFLIGDNPYATTTHFSQGFAQALQRRGVRVRSFYIGKGHFYKAFYAIQRDPPDLTCSFSDITVGNKQPLGSFWAIPHLSLLVDHALYFFHQFQGQHAWIGAMDEEDVAYVQSWGFSPIFLFHHAVDPSLVCSPMTHRPYDVVMLGTCLDYEKIEKGWVGKKAFLKKAAERVLFSEDISCLKALLEEGVTGEDLPLLHQELEKFVKGKERVEMIRSLDTDVHIWGNGKWKQYLPKACVHKSVSYAKALEIMKEAKIVISSAVAHKFSSHERILQPLALGALPITSATAYVKKYFVPGKNVLTNLADVKRLLQDESKRAEMALLGQQEVLKHHTWDQRAAMFLNLVATKTQCC